MRVRIFTFLLLFTLSANLTAMEPSLKRVRIDQVELLNKAMYKMDFKKFDEIFIPGLLIMEERKILFFSLFFTLSANLVAMDYGGNNDLKIAQKAIMSGDVKVFKKKLHFIDNSDYNAVLAYIEAGRVAAEYILKNNIVNYTKDYTGPHKVMEQMEEEIKLLAGFILMKNNFSEYMLFKKFPDVVDVVNKNNEVPDLNLDDFSDEN